MLRVPFNDLYEALRKAMLELGLSEDRAALCARLTAETTRDGHYTHGLNRFSRFQAQVRGGGAFARIAPLLDAGPLAYPLVARVHQARHALVRDDAPAADLATALELPTLIPRLLSGRARSVMRHRQVAPMPELAAARVEAIDDRPFPVQVDGDYIGEYSEVEFGVTPGGLLAVS